MLRQVNMHNQVVIPKEYIHALGIHPEDYLEIRLEKKKGEIRMRPVCLQTSYSSHEMKKLAKLFSRKKGKPMQAKEFLQYLKNL